MLLISIFWSTDQDGQIPHGLKASNPLSSFYSFHNFWDFLVSDKRISGTTKCSIEEAWMLSPKTLFKCSNNSSSSCFISPIIFCSASPTSFHFKGPNLENFCRTRLGLQCKTPLSSYYLTLDTYPLCLITYTLSLFFVPYPQVLFLLRNLGEGCSCHCHFHCHCHCYPKWK